MQFESQVHQQREKYQQDMIKLSRERLQFERQRNQQLEELRKIEAEKQRVHTEMLEIQRDDLLSAQEGLLGITEKYEALQTLRIPQEGLEVDPREIDQAKLDLLMAVVKGGPVAREQFRAIRGLTEETLYGEELLGLKMEGMRALTEQRKAQAARLVAPPVAVEEAAEQKARNEWLTGFQERMVDRYGSMRVAGVGEVSGVADVRKKKQAFFQTEWKENELITSAVDVLRQTGAFAGINLNDLLFSTTVLDAKGHATLENITRAVKQHEQEKGEAMTEALAAVQALKKRREQLQTKASLFNLVEGMVERREGAINATIEDAYAQNRQEAAWATKTETAVKSALAQESETWLELLNEPNFVMEVERYRATATPYADTWIRTAGKLTALLKEKNITDPTLVKYILSLVRMSNPGFQSTTTPAPSK